MRIHGKKSFLHRNSRELAPDPRGPPGNLAKEEANPTGMGKEGMRRAHMRTAHRRSRGRIKRGVARKIKASIRRALREEG